MNRISGIILILSFLATTVHAQFGNEWINYSQPHVKIDIASDGIHSLSGSSLANAGIDLAEIDPATLRLFHRGDEVSILVRDGSDSSFDPSDDLLFYGIRNDGTLDTELYAGGDQLHPFYNLYSDTTSYFLTWGGIAGNRVSGYSIPNPGTITAEDSRRAMVRKVNTNRYARGTNISFDAYFSGFDLGEGFTSTRVQEGNELNFTVEGIVNGVAAKGVPMLTLQLLGERPDDHLAEIWVGPDTGSLRLLGTSSFTGYNTQVFSSALDWSDLSPSGELSVRIEVLGVAGGNDLMSCTYLQVDYPANFDADNSDIVLGLNEKIGEDIFIEVVNIPANPIVWDITDRSDPVEVGYAINAGTLEAIVTNTNEERTLIVAGDINSVEASQVVMTSLDPDDNEFIILTHSSLQQPGGAYQDPVKEYAAYRRSIAGGDLDTLVIDINAVYNQFSYGEKTPLAIYRFVDYMSQNDTPGSLFIIGKALSVRFNYGRNPGSFTYQDLIPTSGFPGSDIAYAIGLQTTDHTPAFPVGRIPASTPEDVANYFDKIKEMESTPYDELWRKDILHLSGGITPFEQGQFFQYMERFRGFAEDVFMGGNVRTIKKNTVENVTFINISEQVNNGQDMVCFYGHSNPNITDIDIGRVSDPINGYNNKGKYPVFLINGCEAGRIFENAKIWGEDWILAKDKGAVQFIAHSSFGLASHLQAFSNLFYENRFSDEIQVNGTIGQAHLGTVSDYAENNGTDNYWHRGMVYQMVLMGDPAYTPFGAAKPDYELNPNQVTTSTTAGELLTAQTEQFTLNIRANNLGYADRDSVRLQIDRYLEDGSLISVDSLFPPIFYSDTLIYVIDNNEGLDYSGLNRFVISIDSDFMYDELNELNNQISFDVDLPLNGTKNLYPSEFGIVASNDFDFLFQSTNPLTKSETYTIELDTSYLFDSPFLISETVNGQVLSSSTLGLLPEAPQNDSTTYYWRTRITNPGPNQSSDWTTSSFSVFYNSGTGWSQTFFPQHLGNTRVNLTPDSVSRRWNFVESSLDINLTTYGDDHPAKNTEVSVRLNDLEYIINNSRPCRDQTLNLIAFDKQSALPYAAVPLIFQDLRTCGRQPQVINSFGVGEFESGTNDLIQYVDDVNQGDTVVLFSIGNIRYSLWSSTIKTKLGELGIDAATIDAMNDKEAIVIVGAKGAAPGTATVLTASTVPADEAEITLIKQLFGRASEGSLNSELIGPALNWAELSYQLIPLENPTSDSYTFDVYGVNNSFDETLQFSEMLTGPRDLTGVDPVSQPYLRIENKLEDETDLTPIQPKRWTVLFDYPPEVVVWSDIIEGTVSLEEGEELEPEFFVRNISNISFPDSLTVEYEVRNRDTGQNWEYSFRILEPAPGDTTRFSVPLSTLDRVGVNDFSLTVNPRIYTEQHYNNNSVTIGEYFSVQKDNLAPTIEAKIDGRFIFDGEIVSASPEIDILLKDENQFRLLNDTTFMDVFIKAPCETCVFERVSYSNSEVSYEAPNSAEELSFSFNPSNLENGVYTLKVEASDASDNSFGDPYQINFEVVNESTVTNFYPYPNPFSDRMHFVFTLTGEEVPDEIRVRITTVTGVVVREIDQDELGAIHIGNNKSSFTWDGTDQFGDRLANGVYLYQVLVRSNGKKIELRDSAGDGAFKNGIGKIYLLR